MATAKEIGAGIKNARLTVGITQAELAHRLGVTPQAVSQYERGIKKPKIETIEKIADALGVSWLHLSHLESLAAAVLTGSGKGLCWEIKKICRECDKNSLQVFRRSILPYTF